jgi:hypothetical protein
MRYAGTGPLQQHLVAFAASESTGAWVTTRAATTAYRGRTPTRPEMVSMRRAVTTLAHQGAIEVQIVHGGRSHRPRQMYRVPRAAPPHAPSTPTSP